MDWTTITEISGGSAATVGGFIAIFWKKLAPFFKSFQKDKAKLAEMKINANKEVEIAKVGNNEGVTKLLVERIDKLELHEKELKLEINELRSELKEEVERRIELESQLAYLKGKYAEKTVLKSHGKKKQDA